MPPKSERIVKSYMQEWNDELYRRMIDAQAMSLMPMIGNFYGTGVAKKVRDIQLKLKPPRRKAMG